MIAAHVVIQDDVFIKDAITVKKGAKVRWTWRGDSSHDVAVVKGPVKFRSSIKQTGTFTRKLTRRGTYQLVCTVHAPDMKMSVKVR